MARRPLIGLELGVKRGAAEALRKAAEILVERMRENASLTDHTLADLKALGHPYSQRNSRDIHNPTFLVHRQSGELLDSIGFNVINQFRVQVGADESIAPHVPHVIFGTSKMVGRDFVIGSFLEIQDQLLKILEEGISEGVKEGGK
jgi:hypothetical protein